MSDPAEIGRELRAELRDDYVGAAPAYTIIRAQDAEEERVVGYMFWDDESGSWRYGRSSSPTHSTELRAPPEQAVDVGMDRIAAELADAED